MPVGRLVCPEEVANLMVFLAGAEWFHRSLYAPQRRPADVVTPRG
jgi:hypothetical protein